MDNNGHGGRFVLEESAVSKGLSFNGGIELSLLKEGKKLTGFRLEPKTPGAKVRCDVLYETVNDLSVLPWLVFMWLEKMVIKNVALDCGPYEWKITPDEAIEIMMAFNLDVWKWESGAGLGSMGVIRYDPITSALTFMAGNRSY